MAFIRNIGWGLFVAFWCMGTIVLGIGLVALIGSGGQVAADVRELGGLGTLLLGYAAAAAAAGIVLGTLRPLIAHPVGIYAVSGCVTSAAVVAVFIVWGDGNGQPFPPRVFAFLVPITIVAGAAFTPLWRRGPAFGGSWYPDPSRLFGGLRHHDSLPPSEKFKSSDRGSV